MTEPERGPHVYGPTVGYHASGHPIFDPVMAPNDMRYSEGPVYDNADTEEDGSHGVRESTLAHNSDLYKTVTAGETSMQYSHRGIYDNTPSQKASADIDFGQPCIKCKTCPGFALHPWRKTCKWCRCSRISHRSKEIIERRAKLLGHDSSAGFSFTDGDMTTLLKLNKYAWTPLGLPPDEVEAYFNCLPDEAVPLIGSEGEIWRHQKLFLQMPPWDTDPALCDDLAPDELQCFKELDEIRIREIFDIGEVVRCPDFSKPASCPECSLKSDGTHWAYCSRYQPPQDPKEMVMAKKMNKLKDSAAQRSIKAMKKGSKPESADSPPPVDIKRELSGGRCRTCCELLYIDEMVVTVGRLEQEQAYFHPHCFICSQCGDLLVDLRCYIDIGKEERDLVGAEPKLFCGRHWAENRRQRCSACDEIIHQRNYVYEFKKAYHLRHFSCVICDASLTDSQTYVPIKKKPHCFLCYTEHFADKCGTCNCAINPLPGFGGKVTIGKKHFHGACYICKICETPLDGKACIPTELGIYCKDCYKELLAQ